jgi:glutaredoxin
MDELNEIASRGDTVLFIHSHNCPHCKDTLPLIEEECADSGDGVNFVECEVTENPHCMKVAKAAGVSGVPVTMSLRSGKDTLKNPEWEVVGARKDELKKKIGKVKSRSASSGSGGGRSDQSSDRAPQRRAPPSGGSPSRRAPSRGSRTPAMDKAIVRRLGSAPQVRPAPQPQTQPRRQEFNAPEPVELCVPNKDCSREEFETRFVDFYSSQF